MYKPLQRLSSQGNRSLPLRLLPGVVGAALLASVAMSPGGAPTAATGVEAEQVSMAVDGHEVSQVTFDGHLISLREYVQSVQPTYERSGKPLAIFYDPSAVARGSFVATSDMAAARRYEARYGDGGDAGTQNQAAGDKLRAQERQLAKSSSTTLGADHITLAGCDSYASNYYARLFDPTGCTGGANTSMLSRDIIYDLDADGLGGSHKISSMWLGQCIYTIKLFSQDNLLGTSATYSGGGHAYDAFGFGNMANSVSTPGSNC